MLFSKTDNNKVYLNLKPSCKKFQKPKKII